MDTTNNNTKGTPVSFLKKAFYVLIFLLCVIGIYVGVTYIDWGSKTTPVSPSTSNTSGNSPINPSTNGTRSVTPSVTPPFYSRTATCNNHGDPDQAHPGSCVCDQNYVGADCRVLSVFQQIKDNVNQSYKIINVSSGAQLQSAQTSTAGEIWDGVTAVSQPGDPNANSPGMTWKFVGTWPNYWIISDYNTDMLCLFKSQDPNMKCIDPYANFNPATAAGYAKFKIEPIDVTTGVCRLRNGNTGGTLMKLKTGSGCGGTKTYDCGVTAGDSGEADDMSTIAQWKIVPVQA